jgi:hypothetical protein
MLPTAVVLGWCGLWAPAFVGFGALWRWPIASTTPLLTQFWTGVAILVALLQIVHFVVPINGFTSAAFLVIGWTLCIWQWRRRRPNVSGPSGTVAIIVWGLGVLWVANRATFASDQYDSLIYHLHTIEWTRAFAIVPGLGNLHDRLALNNSNFLLAAMLEPPGLPGQSGHFLNGLLAVALWTRVVVGARRMWQGHASPADVCALVLLFPLINDASTHHLSSPGTDVPSRLLIFAAVLAMLEWQAAPAGAAPAGPLLFAVSAVCVKLTSLPFALGIAAIAMWRIRRTYGWSIPRPAGAIAVALVGLWLVPWMARGVVLSGYPLYPLSLGRVATDWTVPSELAAAQRQYVAAYAKSGANHRSEFGPEIRGFGWVPAWWHVAFNYAKGLVVVPGALAVASLAWLVLLRRSKPAWDVLAVLAAVCGLWFLVAPNVQFGGAALWALAGVAAAFVLISWPRPFARLAVIGWPMFSVVALLGPMVAAHGLVDVGEGMSRGLIVPPARERLFHPARRVAPPHTFVTASGLLLQVPTQGEGGWRGVELAPDLVIASPLTFAAIGSGTLLRTSYPNPHLRLRDPASLGRGFTIDRRPAPPDWLSALR